MKKVIKNKNTKIINPSKDLIISEDVKSDIIKLLTILTDDHGEIIIICNNWKCTDLNCKLARKIMKKIGGKFERKESRTESEG